MSRLLSALRWACLGCGVAWLSACTTPAPFDYTAFRASRPASVLVLPPLNQTPEVDAINGVLATATQPLAEAGYYVIPVGLMDETFRQNGLTVPNDIQALPHHKLHEIFGADAAMYLTVTKYGSVYRITNSEIRVTVLARLVDLRTGQPLWHGQATAVSQDNNSGGGGAMGVLVRALVQQVVNNVADASYTYAAMANQRLFSINGPDGSLLPGPRRPQPAKTSTAP